MLAVTAAGTYEWHQKMAANASYSVVMCVSYDLATEHGRGGTSYEYEQKVTALPRPFFLYLQLFFTIKNAEPSVLVILMHVDPEILCYLVIKWIPDCFGQAGNFKEVFLL
jgi:hypothetical protein